MLGIITDAKTGRRECAECNEVAMWCQCDPNPFEAEARLTYNALLAKYGTHRHGHSIYAPSGSYGWLFCAGYLLANAVAEDDAGIDAAYGTIAHSVAERWQKHGKKPVKLIGRTEITSAGGKDWEILIDEAMMEFVEEYVNWCDEVPGDHYHEQRVDLSEVLPIPGQGGTADHFACQPGILTITDLKMGTGVRVYAENNPQAMLYALGVFLEWDFIYGFQRIIIRICQPRLNVFEVWECSRQDLLDFAEFVRVRALAAWQENAPRTPGLKQCRFCAVRKTCAARLQQADDVMDAIFGDVDADGSNGYDSSYAADRDTENNLGAVSDKTYFPTTITEDGLKVLPGLNAAWDNRDSWKRLSTHALSYVLTHRQHIEKLFADMAEEALRRAEAGESLPYQKLTDGRRKRVFTDKVKNAAEVSEGTGIPMSKIAPPKVLSPAAIEKLIRAELKWKPAEIKQWMVENAGVTTMAGKRTLADLRDERPDVYDASASIFEDEAEDEEEL